MGVARATWVEETKRELRARGYQFKAAAPGEIAHRWAGTGPEPAEAAPLLADLKDLAWLEWVFNEALGLHEAWVECCYTLAEMQGWPTAALRHNEILSGGQEGWVRWLHGASLQEIREVTAELQRQLARTPRPAPVPEMAAAAGAGRLL